MNKQERAQYRETRLRQLHEIVRESYDEIQIWQGEECMERNANSVSKCYCYKNKGYNNSWWYYLQITGLDENGYLVGWGFEKDNNDEVHIYLELSQQDLGSDYKEIPSEQFWTAWQDIKSELIMLTIANCNKEP